MGSDINTFKYHVSCSDGKISVRINLSFYLYFPPSNICMFLFCRPLVIIEFSTGLVGVEVTSKLTRPVENGLQDRNIHILDGTTVENKGKTIS